jgi:phosphohistidine swiveling domain-containing protein
MTRDENLFKDKMGVIEKATWYRQRFDACPHFMFFLGDAHISNIQHTKYSFGQRIAFAGFSKNRADWYHSLEELEYTTSRIIEAAKADPHISKAMVKDFLPWQEKFYAKCAESELKDLSKLTNKELLDVYNDLAKTYTDKLNSSPLIDGFALSTDTMIASKIKSFLERKDLAEKFVEYFAILTAPTFSSFLREEEIALLKIAKETKQKPQNEKFLLEQHQKDFFWIRNNYVKDHIETVAQFKERLDHFKTIDIDSKIGEIQSLPVHHKDQKDNLMDKIGLPEELRILLEITDDFNAWQDERKKGTFWATHYFSVLLDEFSKRSKYSVEQLKYVFPPEMSDVLTRKIDPAELNKRIEYCMIVWTLNHYDVTSDRFLIEKLDRIGTGEVLRTRQVKGFTASRGKVTGKVKILESADEINKIEDGDVLVTVMTRPDYLSAMKKAVAFVTDEGGITCHAAIIARELKKPCIIGTKIATKVFKDGDMVEVDAEKGIVTKLK